ncbi:MAG TPA: MarR family winged helix-turn-helix transcriptional regulator [Kiloniellales bacterium]|nr:MarR family winged helix-turn-helix transcriptional regulator [Kiloniellales bacterium]
MAKETPQHDCLFNAGRRLSRLLSQAYERQLAPSGLKATQFSLLAALATLGPEGASIARLARALDLEASTFSRNLKPLTRDGLVILTRGEDARVRHVSLTAAGRARYEAALPLWRKAQSHVREALGGKALTRLTKLVREARAL